MSFQKILLLITGIGLALCPTIPDEEPYFSGQIFLKSQLLEQPIYLAQGIANRDHSVSVDSNTVFDIASVNKSFIANLVLQAVAEGRWDLNTELNSLLALYGFDARFKPGITLHLMLCHRSGLGDYDDLPEDYHQDEFRPFKRLHFNNDEYLSFLAQVKQAEAGQDFHYSNFAYHILPILLEAEYGLSFQEILHQKIAKPLGMKVAYAPSSHREIIPHLAVGYRMENGQFRANDYIDLSLGRRIFCRAQELMLWLESGGGRSLLPDSLAALVMQNHLQDITSDKSYGYGWVYYPKGAHYEMGDLDLDPSYFIHGGSTEGFQSLAISVNDGESNLVLLANNGDGKALFERAKSILKNLYEKD
ncbi:serine hydrolase domain-containing protein [Croceimicrobium hydrocarbonivorans]|uniref:Beta-lactamase family protein n=1 Tax=Croceimicrobium hydrocarbonivorans TaxID=2761580 RepID=A0A7H0VF72_9FLAO|nr:serine hydrolase domain-containing protein [Croceimicrobium hydrocarbonivorans]QNR24370.1 beta-lactamase family protein [Croceimicrobium hydrocarbonivorans]